MPTSLSYLRQHLNQLAEQIVAEQYARQTTIWAPVIPARHDFSIRDMGYHLTYLAEAAEAGDSHLFGEYLSWVKVLFANLHFADDVLSVSLECMQAVLSRELPAAERTQFLELLEAGRVILAQAPRTIPSFIAGHEPLDQLTQQFLDLLLQAERRPAMELILNAVQKGTSIQDIYLQVFQRSQREIGRLWQTNQITVAQEHFCTAATQTIMSQLYPYIFTGERKHWRVVVACVGGELHELGARMVADFFEMHGWDSHFLGASTPAGDILRTTQTRRAHILALSATMTYHVSKVAEMIQTLRADDRWPARVIVGGYPFNASPDLWQRVGADGYALDAAAAIREAERLVSLWTTP